MLSPFEDINYPQRWVRPILLPQYQRQETQIMLVGNHLNDYVLARVQN
jgi:hypothetical protein